MFESSAKLVPEDMATSSLKKMSEVRRMKEGNYASLEQTPWGTFTNSDLGLTLLPGSQIQRKDEKRSRTATESSPKKAGSEYVNRSGLEIPSETEIRAKYPTQRTTFPNEAKNPSSSLNLDSKSAKVTPVTTQIGREPPSSQTLIVKDYSGVLPYNVKSAIAAPYNKQQVGTGKNTNANSCQHGDYSPRAMKRRKLGSRAHNEVRSLEVSNGEEAAYETHYNGFHVHYNQGLSESNAIHSGEGKESVAKPGLPFSGTGGRSGSSKPESHRQTTRSLDIAPTPVHQSTIPGSEDTVLHRNSSAIVAFASGLAVKHHHSKLEKLTVYHQPPNVSKACTQYWKESCLLRDTPTNVREQVLKPRKGVNRSWTSHFPAKAKFPCRANLPAPSLLAAPFTPSEDYQHPHLINAPLNFTNLHAYTSFLRPSPPTSLPKYSSVFKSSPYPLDICALEDLFLSAHAGNQRQSTRTRSASMPNLWSTRASTNMDSSSNFGPASIPTPPREKPSSPASLPYSSSLSQYDTSPLRQDLLSPSRDCVDTSCNSDNSSPQLWEPKPNIQHQHEISVSHGQNIALASNLHPRQILVQPFNSQDMSDPSMSEYGVMAAEGLQYGRRRLEVKPSYSHEEVKSLMFHFIKQAQELKAENQNLQSLNVAMKKGIESLRHEKSNMIKQIQRYERTAAQKDRQIKAIQQKGVSLQQQYKQIWDDHHRLIETSRKQNGTGNPSAIAQRIRRNYTSNTTGATSQGNQPSATPSPEYSASRAQLSNLGLEFEQTPTGLQEFVQPLCIPGSSEADVTDASSQSLRQHGYPGTNHNVPNSFQTVSIHAYPEANAAKASSRSSVQPSFAALNHNSASSPHDRSSLWVQSNRPFEATDGTVTIDVWSHSRHMRQVPTERVTIDLTDESQPPSSSASQDTSVLQTLHSSVQCGDSSISLLPGRYSPAQYPARCFESSRYPSGPLIQNQHSHSQQLPSLDSHSTDLEAMKIQREALSRMAGKPLSWLQGENPFRKGTKTEQGNGLPNSRPTSQGNAEESMSFAGSPEAGNIAPLAQTATDWETKKEALKKTKAVMTAEEKKKKAKVYRKTAADKKRRQKEVAEQLLHGKNMSNDAMRAQKQDRRVSKGEKRQEQARKPLEGVGPREPQKTLDGRLYQDDASVQQAVERGSMKQAASGDHDSLFGDDEDSLMEIEDLEASSEVDNAMHEGDAAMEDGVDSTYVAELEALLSADGDAGTTTGFEQNDTLEGDDGHHDCPCGSEESEEE